MINYCVIGNNWGLRIYKILKTQKKNVYLFKTNEKKCSKKYFKELKNYFQKNKISFVWIATSPLKRFQLINFCLNQNLNLILEKPILLKKSQYQFLQKKIKLKKKYCFIHFEYLFLNQLKKLYLKNVKLINMYFQHKKVNKHNINPLLNNGTHLASIKLFYFKKIKNVNYFVTEGKKNERKIEIINNKKVKIIDFTKNKEKIVQKFINYVERVYFFKKKNEIDIKFGYKCSKILNNIK